MKREKWPILGLALVVGFLFCLLVGHYDYIMLVQAPVWQKKAERQHQKMTLQMPKRGLFFSNTTLLQTHIGDSIPFVIDVETFHLHLDPLALPREYHQEITEKLTELLQLSVTKQKQLFEDLERKTHFRRIATWLSSAQKSRITQWWGPYAKRRMLANNALFFTSEDKRVYPFGKLLGQVLHTLAEHRDEKTREVIPTGGIELQFNALLKGKAGQKPWIQSPHHLLEFGEPGLRPEPGADLYLTINHYLQAVAEEELERGVKNAKAKGGWVIMMDPFNGQIFALAQYPFFYPAEYKLYFNDQERRADTKVKAVSDVNEVGSAMKPLTLAICLKANKERQKQGLPPLFTPEEKIAVGNSRFPGRRKPITDVHPLKYLNMAMALQKSSNVYVARLVERLIAAMGNEWYRDALCAFGFGKRTGIELSGESPGLVPTPGKLHPNGALEWSKPTPYSLAMGYNILASSMQIVRAFAVLANGGYLVQPTLLLQARRGNELLIDHTQGAATPERVLDAEIAAQVVQTMKYTTKLGGTAAKADLWGYTEAGKTATTEKIVAGNYSKKNNIAIFTGFAPLSHPRFVLLVAIDEPEPVYIPQVGKNSRAGTCAAPVFQKIGMRTLAYLGVPPDDPHGYPRDDPRYDPDKADWLPQVRALRTLLEDWNR